ncbi:MAG: ABC transporter permease, partial [Cyclobacteriaceae bacterium]|nr:ABC transporter permease [Cyclobacteriaceae bacterium]
LDSLAAIRREVENIYGVYEVSYVESLVESINKNLAKIGALLIGFSIVLLVMVVILINNTIKLALFSQRFLIRSMQLVGATSAFIQRPFLSRSVLYGMVAGSIASASLYLSLSWANKRIDDLASLQNDRELFILIGLLIFMGILVTLLSTYTAIRRYLKISLDELY